MLRNPLGYYQTYEIRHAMLLMQILNVVMALFVVNDFVTIADSRLRFVTIAVRAVYFLECSLFVVVAYKNPRSRCYAPLLYVETALLLALFALTNASRPNSFTTAILPGLIVIAYYFFILPAPSSLKIATAIALSAIEVVFSTAIWRLSLPGRISIFVSLAALDAAGIVNVHQAEKQRRQAHDYRLIQEERLRLGEVLVEHSFDGVAACSGGRIVEWNRQFKEYCLLAGIEESELPGMAIDQLFPPGERGDPPEALCGPDQDLPVEIRKAPIRGGGDDRLLLMIKERIAPSGGDRAGRVSDSARDPELRIKALPLSTREKQVVRTIIEGKTRAAIAEELCISDDTVKKHCANIYKKLGIRSQRELFHLVLG